MDCPPSLATVAIDLLPGPLNVFPGAVGNYPLSGNFLAGNKFIIDNLLTMGTEASDIGLNLLILPYLDFFTRLVTVAERC